MLASFEERGQNNRLVKQTIVDDNKFEKKKQTITTNAYKECSDLLQNLVPRFDFHLIIIETTVSVISNLLAIISYSVRIISL